MARLVPVPRGNASAVAADLAAHEADIANPHSVTAVQAGADPVNSASAAQSAAISAAAADATSKANAAQSAAIAAAALDATSKANAAKSGAEATAALDATAKANAAQTAAELTAAGYVASHTGAVDPHGDRAAAAGALAGHTGDTANPHSVTAGQAGADPSGSASTAEANAKAASMPVSSVVSVAVGDSPYALAAGVAVVLADTAGGPITVTLPAASTPRCVEIKNTDATAAGNDVTITPDAGDDIDGNATWTLVADAGPPIALDAVTLQSPGGTSWMVR